VVQGFTRTNSASGGSLRWFLQFWESELATLGSLLVFLAALLAVSIVSRRKLGAACGEPAALKEHEIVAGLLFFFIPLAAVATAALVTHTFAFRYAELGVAGFCFLVPMLVAHFSGGRAWFGFVLLVATLACIVLARVEIVEPAHPFTGDPELARALEREPVAIADGMLFLQLWYYAPERLKSRIFYLSDNEAAQRYLKNELLENGLKGLRPWVPVQVLDYRTFATPGREFLVYQKKYYISWLLDRIVDDGGSASIEASHDFRTLVRVRIKR
jgi:hypothetical protein